MIAGCEGRCRATLVARWTTALTVVTALTGVPALVAPARADDTEPIHVAYHAPEACPDEAAFVGQVVARTGRARVAASTEVGRTFAITITVDGARARGRLTIAAAAGAPAVRDVAGGSCEEVVSALGLITALAIDPHASTAATVTPPAAPAPKPAAKPRPPPEPPPRFDPMPWWGPIGAPLPVIAAPAAAPRWRPGWGLQLGGASAVAPGVALTLGGYAEVARADGGVLSPAFRLAMIETDSGFRAVDTGHRARFALASGRLEGCPVRADIRPWLAALPCARFEAGQLTASGLAEVGLTSHRPWAAPGVAARLEGLLFERLRLEVEAGVNFPLVRDTFSFGAPPGQVGEVHAVPAAGGTFAAGVGTHFP